LNFATSAEKKEIGLKEKESRLFDMPENEREVSVIF
jgi:hypothetical protein